MRRIIKNSHGHLLKNQKILQFKEFLCVVCSQGKLVVRPSPSKVEIESPRFVIDTSVRWSYMCLLSTCNLTFTRLLSQIIRL